MSQIPILNSIEKIELDSIHVNIEHSIPLKLNLSNWKIYDQLVNSNTLVSIKYDVPNPAEENLLDDIKPFTNLIELVTYKSWNEELLNFPSLERVTIGQVDVGTILTLEKLARLKHYNPSRFNGGDYSYFIQAFLLERLGNKVEFLFGDMYYGEMYNNPLMLSDAYVKTNKKSKKLKSQRLALLTTDLIPVESVYEVFQEDTLAFGQLKKGRKIGIWRYKLYFPTESYGAYFYVNHSDQKEIVLPENGYWEHKYPNGNVACSGYFKDQKRDSTWKEYYYDGRIKSESRLESGLLKWSDQEVTFSGKTQRTRYYHKDNSIVISTGYSENEIYLAQWYNLKLEWGGYKYDNQTGNLYLMNGESAEGELIEQGSFEYEDILFDNYIKFLFPEFKKGKQVIRIKFDNGIIELFD